MPKCVILAGGRGTRISEESHLRPKPMIEVGDRPILWHIMTGPVHRVASRDGLSFPRESRHVVKQLA
jgi:molybdopterin-guanine dinucleotide biosynthesis protein A